MAAAFARTFHRTFARAFHNRFPTPAGEPHDVELAAPYEVSKAATPVAVVVQGAGFAAADVVQLDGVAQTTAAPAADGNSVGGTLALGAAALGFHDVTVVDGVTGVVSNKVPVLVTA